MKTARTILTAFLMLLTMTALTGVLYPLLVTGFAQIIFPDRANGSLVRDGTTVRGSALLAQEFTGARFFHVRPSAGAYAAVPSGASNLSPAGKKLAVVVAERRAAWVKLNGPAPVPSEMLYASGSGLDPDIGLEAALAQVDRVASARSLTEVQKTILIEYIRSNDKAREVFPAPARINVLLLNLALESDSRFAVH